MAARLYLLPTDPMDIDSKPAAVRLYRPHCAAHSNHANLWVMARRDGHVLAVGTLTWCLFGSRKHHRFGKAYCPTAKNCQNNTHPNCLYRRYPNMATVCLIGH